MKALVQAFRAPAFIFETRGEILHFMLQSLSMERWQILLTWPKTSALMRHDTSLHRLKYFVFQPSPSSCRHSVCCVESKCFCDKPHLVENKVFPCKITLTLFFTSKRNKMMKEILYSVHAREAEAGKGGQGECEAVETCGKGVHWPEERSHAEWERSHNGYSYTDTERSW